MFFSRIVIAPFSVHSLRTVFSHMCARFVKFKLFLHPVFTMELGGLVGSGGSGQYVEFALPYLSSYKRLLRFMMLGGVLGLLRVVMLLGLRWWVVIMWLLRVTSLILSRMWLM